MPKSYYDGKFVLNDYMKGKLDAYAESGSGLGGFLRAVLENNLKEAVGRADSGNLENLPAFVMYAYNELPAECWGSPEKVAAWSSIGGLFGKSEKAIREGGAA